MQSIYRTHLGPVKEPQAQTWTVGEGTRAAWSFRDLVHCFMQPERSKANRRPSVDSAVLLGAPLPLHMELKLAKARQLGNTPLTGSQPVSVQSNQTHTGKAGQVEIRTPEIHSDGTVTYNVTALQLAHRVDDVPLQPGIAQGYSVGAIPIIPVTHKPSAALLPFWFIDPEPELPPPKDEP